MTTKLDEPVVVFMDTTGLITLVLGEMDYFKVKFNDTTNAVCVLDIDALTSRGYTPVDNIVEVGV